MRTKLLVAKSLSLVPGQQCQPAACRGGSRRGARAWQSGGGGGVVVVVELGTPPAAGEQTVKLYLELGRSG